MPIEDLERILAAHPFFKGMEPIYHQLFVDCASNVRFEAGAFIFREGEEANQFYLIRHGRVAVEISTPERGAVIIQSLGEGDVLGWSWMMPPYRWHFDARAVELTRAIALDGRCLRERSEADHDLGFQLMKRAAQIMEERFQATRLQLLDVYGGAAAKRQKG
jgi:CRP/FNR family transcriptional regulator, cyclic AMP receptor protein